MLIEEAANGTAFVAYAAGTPYPSLEVYQYGGPTGQPQLLYAYNAQAAGATALSLLRLTVFVATG